MKIIAKNYDTVDGVNLRSTKGMVNMEETLGENATPGTETDLGEKLNPWLTIWYKPRATFRSAINYKNMNLLVFLAIMAGVTETFDRAIAENMGEHMSTLMVFLFIIILGAIVGMLSWLIWSAINYYVGKLLKGKGTIQEMNTAMAISFIPLAVSGIFCLLDVVFLRDALFVEAYLSPFQIGWLFVSAFFVFILSVWSLFLMIKAVAEVHRFSSWKGLLTLLIPTAVIFIIIIGIVIIAMI